MERKDQKPDKELLNGVSPALCSYMHRNASRVVLTNKWVELHDEGLPIKLYLRVGYKPMFVESQGCAIQSTGKCLQLATVEVDDKHRSQGVFASVLMKHLEPLAEAYGLPLYIENVMEERFTSFFEKHGYSIIPLQDSAFASTVSYPRCLFKEFVK